MKAGELEHHMGGGHSDPTRFVRCPKCRTLLRCYPDYAAMRRAGDRIIPTRLALELAQAVIDRELALRASGRGPQWVDLDAPGLDPTWIRQERAMRAILGPIVRGGA